MAPLAPSDIYPAVRRFLVESGLTKSLKAFDKETAVGEDEEAQVTGKAAKRRKALAALELIEACQLWFDANRATVNGVEGSEEKPKKKKELVVEEEAEPAATEKPKKRKRKEMEAEEAEAEEAPAPEAPAAEPVETKKTNKERRKEAKEGKERTSGVPFSRVDDAKWRATITDSRLLDNSHKAKDKFGASKGDSWGDKAAEDMLKVKGKGFRKEMAKKKRASWRGGGEIDQGVNSIKLGSDSDDE
eukprot:gnl/TRDRNA2_/TRDRNA2_44735_c0_seq2.p1 gnl/TRDRNA2_/TRDRNA2_44735_c0~~gnl/TRDRNA2_/TRDRNA2_44735_c0_seq2.p1  ORF type:complete len:245 (-),score=94.81 gnl/TRDRNA2_/TRDRNA2_44735_c0_seq2:165-899(-)